MMSGDRQALRIRREARDWYVLQHIDGDRSDQTRSAFSEWLAADRDHAEMYAQVEDAIEAVALLADTEHASALRASVIDADSETITQRLLNQLRNLFARPIAAAAGVAACALVLSVVVVATTPFGSTSGQASLEYQTLVGETREVILADGTRVHLGAMSSVTVTYDDDIRYVTLARGEAFFDVTADPERPFDVSSSGATVRVIGTLFNVKKLSSGVEVAVEEGRVSVNQCSVCQVEQTIILDKGQATYPSLEVVDIALKDVASWREGRLSYRKTRLGDVVSDIKRHHPLDIRIISPAIADMRVTASFDIGQTEEMIDVLSEALQVGIEKSEDGTILISR